MTGVFYDPRSRRLFRVRGTADPAWMLVTHNLEAGLYHCRRIMSEWLSADELVSVDWSTSEQNG